MKRSFLSYIKTPFFRVMSFLTSCVFAAGLTMSFAVQAVDNIGVFELEQNADMIESEALPGDDWGRLDDPNGDDNCPNVNNKSCGLVAGPPADNSDHPHPGLDGHTGGNSVRHVWLSDFNNPDDIFDKGGSKDDEDISSWRFKLATPSSDKTDMGQGAVAVYLYDHPDTVPVESDVVTYFTANLFADNGVAKIGIWFVKQRLAKSTDGSGTFNEVDSDSTVLDLASHELGDITANMEFVGGGGIPVVSVYMWVGFNPQVNGDGKSTYCVANSIDISGGSDPQYCKPVKSPGTGAVAFVARAEARCNSNGVFNANSPFACATTNTTNTESIDSWGYTAKSNAQPAPGGANPPGTDGIGFDDHKATTTFEGGINMTALGLQGCFSSVVFNTRASGSSVRSIFEDLMMGELSFCAIEVDKSGGELTKAGDTIQYTIDVTNTGVVTLYSDSIIDEGNGWDGLGDLLDGSNTNVDTFGCGTDQGVELAAGDTCTIEAHYVTQAGDPNPLDNEVEAVYRPILGVGGTVSGQEVSDSDTDTAPLFEPGYTIEKLCPAGVTAENPWLVGQELNFRFNITNTSSTGSPILVLGTLTDPLLGDAVVRAAAVLAGADELGANESVDFVVPYTPVAGDVPNRSNSITTTYDADGFENNIEKTATANCPVDRRDSNLITEVHALIDSNSHVDVTNGTVDALTQVHDFAKVTDASGLAAMTPTGDLTFRLFRDPTCQSEEIIGAVPGGDIYPLTITLAGADGGEAETGSFAMPVGTLGWLVTYAGDGTFKGDDTPEPACEPVTGQALPSQTVTFIHDGEPSATHDETTTDIQGDTVQVGATIHDMAKVSAVEAGAPTPRGTVDFRRFDNHTCEGGTEVATESGIGLSGGLAETSAYTITTLGTGQLAYQARYNGDDPDDLYLVSTGPCELLNIELNPSAIVTEVHDAGHGVVSYDNNGNVEIAVGTVIHDWAKVTGGGLAPYDPTGSVTFDLYLGLTCEGEPIKTATAELVDDGNNDAMTTIESLDAAVPIEITTISGDEFSFIASYLGDSVYAAAVDSRCEPVKVQQALEGCTPGYWKQTHHFGNWAVYLPSNNYNTVFGAGPSISLLQALESGGNTNSEALLRHSVAALLNSVGDVAYAYSEAQVLAMVKAAWEGTEADRQALHILLAEANERDCPLSRAEQL